MKRFRLFLALSLALLALVSCGGKQKNKQIFMPSVSGKAGEVLIVIDKPYWEGDIGSVLKSSFTAEYPFLPQREPLFNVYNTTPSSFKSYGSYSTHRNIVMVNIGNSYSEPKISYKEDAWAAPQILVTISAPSEKEAYDAIVENKEMIINAIEQKERNRIIANAKKYQELSIRDIVLKDFGGSPYFPQGYSIKKNVPGFIWISYETSYVNQGLFVYSYPYDGKEITLAKIINNRNEVLKRNVPAMIEGSYMTTSSMVMPGFQWIKYKDHTFAEVRGLWETVGDYMGGPFVSHVYVDSENQKVVILEGFVYAPRYDKRNYLRHVESVLYSFEWNK